MTRWTARGTHRGELQGIPATGKVVRMTGSDIDRIVDGKTVECWAQVDELSLLQQLGVIQAGGHQ
jgi:predicted ester cyclase